MDKHELASLQMELNVVRGEQDDALEAARRLRAHGASYAEIKEALSRAEHLQSRIDDLQRNLDAAQGMLPSSPDTPPSEPSTDWPESVLPGARSGEGSNDLFRHIQRDIRRKAGLPSARKPGDKK